MGSSEPVEGTDPERGRFYNRFPEDFPGRQTYAAGFGSSVDRRWLQTNMAEYSRHTFDVIKAFEGTWHDRSGLPVELHGNPEPGTLVVQLGSHRSDLAGRIGIVTSTCSSEALDVVWGPWEFKEGA